MAEKKKTIVLVEDERTISNLIELKLERSGYKVETAHDGKVGLDLILELKPDLVLLDIALPTLGGFDILNKLKEKKLLPRLPIIIISNSGQPIEIDRAKDAGVRDYLIKVNFSPEEVLEKVKLIFEEEKKESKGKTFDTSHILFVEDEKFIADLVMDHLGKEGLELDLARDAETAMRKVRKNRPKLILLDLVLPGMDGYEFLEKIKADKELASIPVIILSNLGQKSEVERAIKLGAEAFLVKANLDLDEISQKIKKSLEKIQ